MANSYVFYANKNGRPTGLPGFVGPKGPQGEQGEQGIQGPQGEPGIFIGAEEDMPAGTRARFDPNGSPDIAAVINDANISEDETWSSSKINRDLTNMKVKKITKQLVFNSDGEAELDMSVSDAVVISVVRNGARFSLYIYNNAWKVQAWSTSNGNLITAMRGSTINCEIYYI